MVVTGPAVPVAVNVTGLPVNVPLVAVTVLAPATAPSVHVVLAMPLAFETTGCVPTDPPPVTTAKVTLTPPIGLPNASVTSALMGDPRAVPTAPLCPLPPLIASVVAA